ncbi:Arginine N-methyltransferase 2 [Pleurostoma richardsiae]|uniref:Arginine N-methyltransferase 2 n=1 Tax=Pleurostoma richardsiae TaxID=41990 RepID=A0AA38RLL0_9PEZI|nr:Arginine N-methyltransferase 2 [Pleurostoma richardsiae]
MAPYNDDIHSRISPSCPADTSHILHLAWAHDAAALHTVLDAPGKASCQDPSTRETPLHAAVRACGPAPSSSSAEVEAEIDDTSAAQATVRELFLSGAIWNDVDDHDETPGCVALRLGRRALYELCVEAGVRAELLFGLLEGYQELSSGSEEDDEGLEDDEADEAEANGHEGENGQQQEAADAEQPSVAEADKEQVTSEAYLRSRLTYSDGKLVDDAGNGVMMAWETDIMRRSVDALLPSRPAGKRILNIGFGMGIVDSMFAETKPARHHIIEAHEGVLARLAEPGSAFGAEWEASGSEEGAYKVHRGRWQDVVPALLERGEQYDAVYFDTFGEDYGQLRMFFTEHIPGLLDERGIFSFFNGLGADRRICYDVYTRVAEAHLADAGLDVEWQEIDVDLKGLEEAGKGEWEGVRRRYWTLDKYRLPVCTFLG